MADEFESGFAVRTPSWHHKEDLFEEYQAHEDLLRLAGLEWEPEVAPAYMRVTLQAGEEVPAGFVPLGDASTVTQVDDDGEARVVIAPGSKVEGFSPSEQTRIVSRSDNGRQLGDVTPTWSPFLNKWMVEVLDQIATEGKGTAKVETMMSLAGGRKTFALVRLDEPLEVAGDSTLTYPFLALLNDHTGGGAAKALYTMVRVVCMNTYRMAELMGAGQGFTFRHVGDLREQFEEAKGALAGLRTSFTEWVQLAEVLQQARVTDEQVAEFTNLWLPVLPNQTERSQDIHRGYQRDFRRLYEESVTTEAHRGTALGLLDAAVEFNDYGRKTIGRQAMIQRTFVKPQVGKRSALGFIDNIVGLGLNVPGVSAEEMVAALN